MTVTQARAALEAIKAAVAEAEAKLIEIETLPPEAAAAFTAAMLQIAQAMTVVQP